MAEGDSQRMSNPSAKPDNCDVEKLKPMARTAKSTACQW